jgi:RimJ/RimL family protein N-acetyltransferase
MNLIAESPSLILRDLSPDDWPGVFAYTGDEAVSRYQAWAPHSERDAQAWIALSIAERLRTPRRMYYWGICRKDTDQIIGGLGIELLPEENAGSAEIGYSLRKDHWRLGFGKEALTAALKFAFQKTEIRRLVAHCREKNLASFRLLEKVGFRREGHFIEDVRVRGELMSSYWYALTRAEWSSRTQA